MLGTLFLYITYLYIAILGYYGWIISIPVGIRFAYLAQKQHSIRHLILSILFLIPPIFALIQKIAGKI